MAQPTKKVTDEVSPTPPVAATPTTNPEVAKKKSNKKIIIIICVVLFFVVILPAILFTVGMTYLFNKGGEKLVEEAAKSQGVDLDVSGISSDGISIKDKDGNEFSTKSSKELPEDFPKEVIKLYDGTITNTSRIKLGETTSWTVQIETDDSQTTVAQKVKEDLATGGWEVKAELSQSEYTSITAEKAGYYVTISITPEEAKSLVSYSIGAQ